MKQSRRTNGSHRPLALALTAVIILTRCSIAGPPAEQWLVEYQRPPAKILANAASLAPLLVDRKGEPLTDRRSWLARRDKLRALWLEFLQPIDVEKTSSKYEVIAAEQVDECLRQLIRYECEPGIFVEAYLLQPRIADESQRLPGVVVFHSTVEYTIREPAGLEGDPNLFFGLELAKRGVVALCPRCFLWQDTREYDEQVADFQRRHPGSKGMAKMLWDGQRAVDVLANHSLVDPQRIGAIGHSLGAKEVLYLAAFDDRVRVTVSSEGGIGRKFSNWKDPWYLGVDVDQFPREHHELLAMIAPRPFLLVGGDLADGARSWPFIAAALDIYELYPTPARLGLYNHKQGHAPPAETTDRMLAWLIAYL